MMQGGWRAAQGHTGEGNGARGSGSAAQEQQGTRGAQEAMARTPRTAAACWRCSAGWRTESRGASSRGQGGNALSRGRDGTVGGTRGSATVLVVAAALHRSRARGARKRPWRVCPERWQPAGGAAQGGAQRAGVQAAGARGGDALLRSRDGAVGGTRGSGDGSAGCRRREGSWGCTAL
jgi:hypothetical protein